MPSGINYWARPIPNSVPEDGWRCGFCHSTFSDWKKRVNHVRAHFDSGLDMQSWDISLSSIVLSRVSRRALQASTVYGCSKCRRCFKTKPELSKHQQLPHLARGEWTCGDAFSGLISSIPETSRLSELSHFYVTLEEPQITKCFHCGWARAPSRTSSDSHFDL